MRNIIAGLSAGVAFIIILLTLVLGLANLAKAADVTLQWNAVSNADGYKIYHSIESGAYLTPVDKGSETTHTFEGLAEGMSHYFVATAYNEWGESGYSTEAGIYILSDEEQEAQKAPNPGNVRSTSITYHLDNGSTVVIVAP